VRITYTGEEISEAIVELLHLKHPSIEARNAWVGNCPHTGEIIVEVNLGGSLVDERNQEPG
jgi:hypothetical protein